MDTPPEKQKSKAIVLAGNRGLEFRSLDEMYRFCVAMVAGKEFKDIDSPEQALIRVQAGLEIGLTPIWSLTNIMVVNGRPSVWGDALLGLVLAHPDCEDVLETIENEGTDDETAVCEVRRRGRAPIIRKFSVQDVKRAGLDRKTQSVHGPYPRRMRQMRARSWACRDGFADVLRGLGVIEEAREIPQAKARVVAPMVLPDEVTKGGENIAEEKKEQGEEGRGNGILNEVSAAPVLAEPEPREANVSDNLVGGEARESTDDHDDPRGGTQSPEERDPTSGEFKW